MTEEQLEDDQYEEELEEELRRGRIAARELAEHLERMGGTEKASIATQTNNGCYIIEVRKTL